MNYEPLHHKYRPQTFADLVGQEAIAATLTNAITSQRIAPAYLFTGSRGTGKTSSARILAKSLNCLAFNKPTPKPCGVCDVCRGIAHGVAMDVIEIDAASNTGVDNIREIIEKSHFAPVQCRYKVYAIDEVHGLTNQAFNALLKTLEEPPERVVFILATTDPQRVLPTIISRCQRFDFRRIPLESMVAHLLWIAHQEKINITEEAVRLVAQISQGGLRDAESLLDQLSLLKDGVTAEKVWDLVGAVSEIDLLAMVQAIAEGDHETIINRARNLMDRGKEPMIVLQNLGGFYRDLLIAKTAPHSTDLVALTASTWQQLTQEANRWTTDKILAGSKYLRDSEVQIKNTTQPRLWLEVTLLGLLLPDQSGVMPLLAAPGVAAAKVPAGQVGSPNHEGAVVSGHAAATGDRANGYTNGQNGQNGHAPQSPELTSGAINPVEVSEQNSNAAPPEPEVDEMLETWQEVVEHIPMLSTQAFLTQHCCLLQFDGVVAIIGITNQNLVSTAKRKQEEIENAFTKLCGRKVVVQLQIGKKLPIPETPENSPSPQPSSAPTTSSVQEPKNDYVNGANGSGVNQGNGVSSGNDHGGGSYPQYASAKANNGNGHGSNGNNGHGNTNGNGQVASRSTSPTPGFAIEPPRATSGVSQVAVIPVPPASSTNLTNQVSTPNFALKATETPSEIPLETSTESLEGENLSSDRASLAALEQISNFF
ncbi:MAG: DNA polymerase III subunit gamma/tau [Coleofasciculaceae cyanobacterium SM2_1_6]|nr:DNA polymerase III subunit gamma/tau [Coleofasciculaceae cyanobacterium SM2_1_6]